MRLDDIAWEEGTIRVRGKGRREICLPLPQDAGDALLEYLTHARPNAGYDQVFLRTLAPWRPLSNISSLVRWRLERAGITDAPSHGARLLRHSAATGMLRAGATLDAVPVIISAWPRRRSVATSSTGRRRPGSGLLQAMPSAIQSGSPCRGARSANAPVGSKTVVGVAASAVHNAEASPTARRLSRRSTASAAITPDGFERQVFRLAQRRATASCAPQPAKTVQVTHRLVLVMIRPGNRRVTDGSFADTDNARWEGLCGAGSLENVTRTARFSDGQAPDLVPVLYTCRDHYYGCCADPLERASNVLDRQAGGGSGACCSSGRADSPLYAGC